MVVTSRHLQNRCGQLTGMVTDDFNLIASYLVGVHFRQCC